MQHPWRLAALVLVLSACTGDIGDSGTASSASGGTGGAGGSGPSGTGGGNAWGSDAGTGGSGVPIDSVVGTDPDALPDGVPASSRVLRLGYADYDRTLSDLLYLPVAASQNFPEEQPNLGPYEDHGARFVGERLYNELTRNAELLAEQVVSTDPSYGQVVGCDPSAPGCRDQFIDGFGRRAFRRPLTDSERERYRALFDSAGELYQSGDAFRDGVRLVLEAMLQSPNFLYRIEVGSGEAGTHGSRLTNYEIASRLSYMLLGTLPDDALLQAAADGRLSTIAEVAEQVRRLAGTPRFVERVVEFHERWMQLGELTSVTKDDLTYPEFSAEFLESARLEARSFIEEVTLVQGGTVGALLTAPFGFVDERLAGVYDLGGSFGPEPVRVEHPASAERRGLFTQAAFLTGHSSSSSGTSPILRGVFLLRRVACENIPDPPPGAQMQEPSIAPAQELRTTREYFTWKTSMATCVSCHERINPAGFAFELFDGIGGLRATENGAPVDATGTLTLGQSSIAFHGAAELLQGLAQLEQVRACYAKNWLQYAYGREAKAEDLRTLGIASKSMATPGFGVVELLTAVTQRPAFTHLPALSE